MPLVDLDDSAEHVFIKTTYTDRSLITLLPGARFDKKRDGWTAPLSWATCVTLRGLFKDRLEVGSDLVKWSRYEHTGRILPAVLTRDQIDPSAVQLNERQQHALERLDKLEANEVVNPNGYRLYPYQRVDVAYLTSALRALLCNEPGLGKTGTMIRTLQVLDGLAEFPFPAVVVCPNTLKTTVWKKELNTWAPTLKVSVIEGGVAARRKAIQAKADVYVINWESLRLHSRLANYGSIELTDKEREPKELNELNPRTAIFDEAHRSKDPHAKQTRAAWYLSWQAEFRFAMTGTPVANHVGEAWTMLHLVDPDSFPTRQKWTDRYVQLAPNFYGGSTVVGLKPETRDELAKFTDPLIRRAPKNLALPQLPDKLPTEYRQTEMGPGQKKAYLQMQELMVTQLEEGIITASNSLTKLARLSQFASATAFLDEDENVKLKLPSNKVDDLVELLEDMGDEPLVVGAVSRQLIELAAERLANLNISHGLITGAQSTDERAKNVDAFQAGKTRVILCTLAAGAVGITLTRASTMLFMQESWSAVENRQMEDRIHRIGQKNCVRILKQVTPGTFEERRIEVLLGKEEQLQSLVRDADVIKKLLGVK